VAREEEFVEVFLDKLNGKYVEFRFSYGSQITDLLLIIFNLVQIIRAHGHYLVFINYLLFIEFKINPVGYV
jgi:hypothetical protein